MSRIYATNVRNAFTKNTIFVNRLRKEQSQSVHIPVETPSQYQVFGGSFATAVRIANLSSACGCMLLHEITDQLTAVTDALKPVTTLLVAPSLHTG